jgi:hypothetical protein
MQMNNGAQQCAPPCIWPYSDQKALATHPAKLDNLAIKRTSRERP